MKNNSASGSDKPIINCHTHIFTGDHVPPWLAKTFLPAPFYFLLHVPIIVKIFRWWYTSPFSPYDWQFQPWNKKLQRILYQIKISLIRYRILRIIKFLAGFIIIATLLFDLYDWKLKELISDYPKAVRQIDRIREWLGNHYLLVLNENFWVKLGLILLILIFFPSGRNLLWFILRKTSSFIAMLPGKQTTELIKRYINIIRFSRYASQGGIFGRLRSQYPDGTAFVVLPMDMEYMDAGALKPEYRYRNQMSKLVTLKETFENLIYPFVFADPRRFVAADKEKNFQAKTKTTSADEAYFTYSVVNGKVKLGDCFIKKYIETHKFSGVKIYPALGYYPFDEKLLPLWKYAADNGIPVLTHCIRGTIFYRGKKEKIWDQHPVFEQAMGKNKNSEEENGEEKKAEGQYKKLILPQMKNKDFINNFTHPLNYLCLLEEELLRKIVSQGIKKEPLLKQVFGFTDENTPLKYDLRNMKICFGHFGGDDEWKNFFEKDRDLHSIQLVKKPDHGVNFLYDDKKERIRGKLEQLWKDADWYTIICSLMLQYPNVYSDISYILHEESGILPLLKYTLTNPRLKQRVLFGTDFYVVRNHKSDKNMLADMMGGLDEEEFDLIARENPREFLYNKLHGAVPDTTCDLPANYFKKQ